MFLHGDDLGLTLQLKNVHTNEYQLNMTFGNIWEWFADNDLCIHLGEDKTKCVLSGLKQKFKNARKLNVIYNEIKIKQYPILELHTAWDNAWRTYGIKNHWKYKSTIDVCI